VFALFKVKLYPDYFSSPLLQMMVKMAHFEKGKSQESQIYDDDLNICKFDLRDF